MKKIMIFPVLLTVLLLVSCGKDDNVIDQITTNLDIKLTATYDGEPLEMLKEYTLCDGKKIKFETFNFYVSDIVLLKENDPQTPVTELLEIDFIDLSKGSIEGAEAGDTLKIKNVPIGIYPGIQLGLGVTADLNRTIPTDYGSSSPLAKGSHYWPGWGSYIFAMIGGFADFNDDGTIETGDEKFAYHNGDDVSYAIASVSKNITLEEGVDKTIHLNLDVSAVFDIVNPKFDPNGDGCLDVNEFRGTHSGLSEDDNKEIMADMMKRLANSITMGF